MDVDVGIRFVILMEQGDSRQMLWLGHGHGGVVPMA